MKYWKINPNSDTTTQNTGFPKTWGVECEYCKTWDNAHETEVLRKAAHLCTENKYFPQFVQAELDCMDHSKMDKVGQMQFLLKIHRDSGCTCLDHLFEPILEATKIDFDPKALRAILTRSTPEPSTRYPKHDQQASTGTTDGPLPQGFPQQPASSPKIN